MFDGADSDVGSGISALLSSRLSADRTLFNARPVGDAHHQFDWLLHEDGPFTSSVFLISPSTRIRLFSVWPCARPLLTNALQPRQRSDVPCAMKSLCLRYSLLGTGSRFGSGGKNIDRVPLQTLCSGIGFSLVFLSNMRTQLASTPNHRPRRDLFCDTIFPSVVSVGSLDRPDHAEPPVKLYHDVARRLEAKSQATLPPCTSD